MQYSRWKRALLSLEFFLKCRCLLRKHNCNLNKHTATWASLGVPQISIIKHRFLTIILPFWPPTQHTSSFTAYCNFWTHIIQHHYIDHIHSKQPRSPLARNASPARHHSTSTPLTVLGPSEGYAARGQDPHNNHHRHHPPTSLLALGWSCECHFAPSPHHT